ncbi:DMT family transporter [Pleomorphomonas oryzae]|uniref:DMT family transporter n=1 Tax=Pleomorphomonas oryzae TaxID=261934 RepID=UPI0004016387|nr:DMT family transporter [Pleomorphomonas oryzae]
MTTFTGTPRVGVALALCCLMLLGAMPVIVGGRPAGASALTFALLYSVWQLVFSLPLTLAEARAGKGGVFRSGLPQGERRKILGTALFTGALFALAAWAYVLGFEKVGAVNAAIALQIYPLLAASLEAALFGRRKSRTELLFTLLIVGALFHLATGGRWQMTGLSPWFAVALAVPLLWAVAHVILRETLLRTAATPNEVTTSRLVIVVVLLTPLALVVDGPAAVVAAATDTMTEAFTVAMGLAYYVELILWFHAVRHIDVSVASSVTVPAPAVTLLLSMAFLGATAEAYQLAALTGVVAGLLGLMWASTRRVRPA